MTIANSIVLADNAYGTIATGLSVSDTALSFTTGHGARFPAVAAGQVMYCCLLNAGNVLEEIQITAHANGADSATIVRGAGSTTAKTWTTGDRIEARVSSTALKRLQDEAMKKTTLTTADSGATYTGAMDVPGLGYVTGLVYAMTIATTNIGNAPTIALDGLPATTVVLDGGGALASSQMPLNGLYEYDGTNFILLNPLNGSWSTGDVKLTLKVVADPSWIMANDGSIGDATSSATTRANADTSALYTLIWNNVIDTWAPVSGGRGLTAAADFAAHKRITLTAMLGRALAIAGTGATLTARTLGQTLGEETHLMTLGELVTHAHLQASNTLIQTGGNTYGGLGSGSTGGTTQNAGSSTPFNVMQPTSFLNAMIKL